MRITPGLVIDGDAPAPGPASKSRSAMGTPARSPAVMRPPSLDDVDAPDVPRSIFAGRSIAHKSQRPARRLAFWMTQECLWTTTCRFRRGRGSSSTAAEVGDPAEDGV